MRCVLMAVLGILGLLAFACGGNGKGLSLNTGGVDEGQRDVTDREEVEEFAIDFAQRVAAGDSDWVGEHCGDYGGCDYEELVNCGDSAHSAEAGRHPDPQGQWLAVVRLSQCGSDGEDAAPCFGLSVQKTGNTWEADAFDHGAPSDSSDCPLDSEYWRY